MRSGIWHTPPSTVSRGGEDLITGRTTTTTRPPGSLVDHSVYPHDGRRIRTAARSTGEPERRAPSHHGCDALSAAHTDPGARPALVRDYHRGARLVTDYFLDSSALVK